MAKKLFSFKMTDAPLVNGKPDKNFDPRHASHKKLEELYLAGYPPQTECRETVCEDGCSMEYSVWDGPAGSIRDGQIPAEPPKPTSPVLDKAFAKLVAQELAEILKVTK